MSLQNLFVAKLPRNIGDADLLNIFTEFGPFSAKIMLDAATGKSKGFGFVLFDEEEKGAKAYNALNRKMTRACGHSFTLVIYPSNHNGKIFTEESNALYIRNIPMSVGQEKMEHFLKSFGNLIYFAMREDHYGSPVWVVYAEYETVEDAKNALAKLHGNSTYFHGSVPILAKFEDSDDAKKARRRRRDGTQTHAPNSGCIFPPPHNHHESTGSLPTCATTLGSENGLSHINSVSSNRIMETKMTPTSTVAPRGCCTGRLTAPRANPSFSNAPPPPFQPALTDVTQHPPTPVYSMPQPLPQPMPGYCYTLSESGHQIFIPASSFSPPISPYDFSHAAQSAPLLLVSATLPTTETGAKSNFPLLNSTTNTPVMLMENRPQYVLAPDAVNINCDPFTSPTSSLAPRITDSQSTTLLGVRRNQPTYTSGSASVMRAFSVSHDSSYVEPLQVVPTRCDTDGGHLGEAGVTSLNNEAVRVHALQEPRVEGHSTTGRSELGVGW
ncbi:putative RNA recognition motif (RRM, RBD, or RNP domain) [Leishmania utingensis]|uniref:RNA recognition motif (RRM, RBD, or RNP domain) n=1 Tax=Leishmania utingensis TaxID=653362 RepID=A0AAW3A6Y5_9TRYP